MTSQDPEKPAVASQKTTVPEERAAQLNDRLEYTYELFRYVCFLNDKAENRANYLILANSVVLVGILSALNSSSELELNIYMKYLVFACLMSLAISIICSVGAVLPRTYDHGIPINHGVIGRMEANDYVARLIRTSEIEIQTHFGLEIHILCRIVNTRFAYVGWAAKLFFVGVFLGLTCGVWVFVSVISP